MIPASNRIFSFLFGILLCTLLAVIVGCRSRSTESSDQTATENPKSYPELPAGRRLEPGVLVHEVTLQNGDQRRVLWVYLPEQPTEAKLPCVFIAPAGSTLFYGMDLAENDRAEHLPYVRAGFAVVAFSLDGGVSGRDPAVILAGAKAFKQAEAGLVNARLAIDYALAKVDKVDPNRLYCTGHSSAATHSLLLAENEPRIKACMAFAPCTNVPGRVRQQWIERLDRSIPGFKEFLEDTSPHTHPGMLRCPLFLFHAEDDKNTPITESITFNTEVKKTNRKVTFVRAQRGGHYNSMIKEGIPQAIQWLKKLMNE